MIRKMSPVKLSDETKQNIQKQLNAQIVERSAPKSTDPKHFPVFSIPAGQKILIYVPNHTVQLEDGSHQLRMDMPILHPVQDGNRFRYFRCINGIVDDEAGYDGTCPLCEGTSEPWDLARAKIEQKCKAQGLDPEDTENKDVKAIRTAEFGDRVLKEGDRYYTFPIVVFETDKDCKQFRKDDKGNIKYTIQWYNIRESKYADTWGKAIAEMEDEPETPAGYFFVLSYVYDTKGKQPNSRDAAKNLSVHPKTKIGTLKGMDKLKEQLDKQTEEWTPEKAAETVISNNLFSKEDLEGAANDLLASTRTMLAMMQGMPDAGATPAISAPNAVPALQLGAKVETSETPVSMDETDEDFTLVEDI